MALAALVTGLALSNALTTRHLAQQQEFCFAEWCVTPTAVESGPGGLHVGVHVRSEAKAASQRPDHPQAWLVDHFGARVGGPEPALDRLVGPGESYDAVMVFASTGGSCLKLLMSEGAWPPFLGLGYAPSPFTESVDWPLCP